MAYKFSRSSKNSFYVGIFLILIFFTLSSSKWEGAFIERWGELSSGVDFYSSSRGTEAPYLKPIGDINDDSYPDVLIHDSFEKSIVILNNSDMNDIGVNYDKKCMENLTELYPEYLNNYGKSTLGVYSLNGSVQLPEFIWSKNPSNEFLKDCDILMCEIIGDIDNDNIKDIFLSLGKVRTIPDPSLFGLNTHLELFQAKPEVISSFFTIDNTTDWVRITPKYLEYKIFVLSGKTGNIINSNEISDLAVSRNVIDIVALNISESSQYYPNASNYVLLTTNVSSTQYYLDKLTRDNDIDDRNNDLGIHGLYLNETYMNIVWDKNNQNLDITEDLIEIKDSETLFSGNTSYFYADSIELEGFGENFILKYHTKYYTKSDGTEWRFFEDSGYREICTVFNGSSGELLWNGNSSMRYISNNIDINGDGFGQINGFYTEGTDLNFVLFNSSDGSLLSKAKIVYNASSYIHYNNTRVLFSLLSDDNLMGNDNFYEIIVVCFNNSYYEEQKWRSDGGFDENLYNTPEYLQFARINLNLSEISMIITPILEMPMIFKEYIREYSIPEIQLRRTGVDLDGDGWKDYLIEGRSWENRETKIDEERKLISIPISGKGIKLRKRYTDIAYSSYIPSILDDIYFQCDFRDFDEITYFFTIEDGQNRIGILNSNSDELVYIQDLNTFSPGLPLISFFNRADWLMYCIIIGIVICLIGFIKGVQKVRTKPKLLDDGLPKVVKVNWILMFILVSLVLSYFTLVISYEIGYTNVAITPEGQLIWFLVLYPAIFTFFVIIPELYSISAPYFAEKVFIKFQKAYYKYYIERKYKDYQIVVIKMVENQRVSPNNKIKRALLPLVISMTFGIFIYQGLGPNGILFALFGPNTVNWIDHPLTHPGTLGVMTAAMSSPNELYFEIGYFARYCISPMIITFILLSLLIPGAWLLDDAGVCFYEKPLADRMVSDVERVSKWTLSKTTGLFGFTGGVSFFSLFLPMLLNLDDLIYYLGILSEGENVIFGIYVLLLALIVFPILAGILLMYGAMLRMEEDLDKNRSKLYKRLKKNEIDTDPLDLSVFLDAKEKKNKDIFEVKRGL